MREQSSSANGPVARTLGAVMVAGRSRTDGTNVGMDHWMPEKAPCFHDTRRLSQQLALGRWPFLLLGFVLTLSGVAAKSAEQEIRQYGVIEKEFRHSGSYDNPYKALQGAHATLNAPDGTSHRIELFWDGGNEWRFRFSPAQLGEWTWRTHADDGGLDEKSGRFRVVESEARGGIEAMEGHPDHFQYHDLHQEVVKSVKAHGKPVVNSEYAYFLHDRDGNGDTDKANSVTVESIRHATWDIVMGGGYFITGFGSTYFGGHRHPGPFDVDMKENDPWEEDVRHVLRCWRSSWFGCAYMDAAKQNGLGAAFAAVTLI